MIHLLFVGDGERDAVTVPRLVERILDTSVSEDARAWARLHGAGKGYAHKLRYALRQARDIEAEGLVATVDADAEKRGVRLRKMKQARKRDRDRANAPVLPTALGEAVPHGEAWLLDDPVAVRRVLSLPEDERIPTTKRAKNPKKALHDLLAQSERAEDRPVDVWAEIAREVDPARCKHARATGFGPFINEVHEELGPLAARFRNVQ